jgi:hypothetical protein
MQNNAVKTDERINMDSTFGSNILPPMWGKVAKISGPNHVDLQLANGINLTYVPIISLKWVKKLDSKSTGRKDIPTEGSKVLVIFPDGIMDNALVLCSGFDPLVEWQKAEILVEDEENLIIEVDEYGWKTTINKTDGSHLIESPDDHIIRIDADGIYVKDPSGNEILMDASGTIVTDSNGNTITMSSSGISLEDSNGNTIEMAATSVKINGTSLEVLQ